MFSLVNDTISCQFLNYSNRQSCQGLSFLLFPIAKHRRECILGLKGLDASVLTAALELYTVVQLVELE